MENLTRLLKVTFLLAFFTITAGIIFISFADDDEKNVLILHSYNIDYSWTQDQHNAFINSLNGNDISPRYSVEIMDTKKYSGAINYAEFKRVISLKHPNRAYDLIYATDNDAFNFLKLYGEELFPNTPVVVSGVNYGSDLKELSPNLHVIVEKPEFDKTLDYMMAVQPLIDDIYVVNDQSTTGKIVRKQLQNIFNKKYPDLKIHWIENASLSQFKDIFQPLGETDGILFTIYQTNGQNEVYQYNESLEALLGYVSTPVWCTWSFSMNTGAIGGFLASGDAQGKRAAETAYELLNGQSATQIVYDTSALNITQIDYEVLKKYQISESLFPYNTKFLNKPEGYFEKYRFILTVFAIVVIIMSSIIAVLLRLVHYQKIIHKQNSELLELKSAIISSQKEIVFRMSELIETRSHDTGNHVRRVALISRIIGEKLGLDEETLQSLETAAPMHDVGKIGIPETILEKPDLLNTSERKVINKHAQIGYKIFQNTDLPVFQTAAQIAHQHHENWDGSGYPEGLAGEEIDQLARIVALSDVFDALLSKRTYKRSWSLDETVTYIRSQSGIKFEPHLVDSFINALPEIQQVLERYKDS